MKRSERALPFGRALSDKGVKCNGDDALAWRAADAGIDCSDRRSGWTEDHKRPRFCNWRR